MRGMVNDALRFVIALVIRRLGFVLDVWQRIRIFRFKTNQRRLRQKYRLQSDTPVLSYGPRVVESIRHAAARCKTDARFAMTSGSTGEAKQILYTKRRLRSLKFVFSDMFARACRAYRRKRTSLYVFSSFQQDASLTSLLLDEHELPHYFSTLQAPYRVQQHPAIRTLAAEYGAAAVRLWILALSNPGVLYATNPSTISTFLDELNNNWPTCSRLVRNWRDDPASLRSFRSQACSSTRIARQHATIPTNRHEQRTSSAPTVRAIGERLHLLDRRLRPTISRSTRRSPAFPALSLDPDVFDVD